MMKEPYKSIGTIAPANEAWKKASANRWNQIAKPLHSLGRLEDAVIKLCGISQDSLRERLGKAALVILCGDHGVVEEGVTQTGQEVTGIVAGNFTKGNSCVSAMARVADVDVFPVDMGMVSPGGAFLQERLGEGNLTLKGYLQEELRPGCLAPCRLRAGTGNIAEEPAMSKEECEEALSVGIAIAGLLKERGYGIIATGEMGIGNTTPSSALASVLLGESPAAVTGKGAGLPPHKVDLKKRVVEKAVKRYENSMGMTCTQTIGQDRMVTLMAELGGLEIAGMTGLFLGGAIHGIPVLADGFISSVAALCAMGIEPWTGDYFLASHLSGEPAGARILEEMKLLPLLTCDMCLGEGSGAVAAIPLLRMAAAVYEEMSTFEENTIEEYQEFL